MKMMLFFGGFQQSGNNLSEFIKNINKYIEKAKKIGYPTYGEGKISNHFQRLGYEAIKTLNDFNKKYNLIWED